MVNFGISTRRTSYFASKAYPIMEQKGLLKISKTVKLCMTIRDTLDVTGLVNHINNTNRVK